MDFKYKKHISRPKFQKAGNTIADIGLILELYDNIKNPSLNNKIGIGVGVASLFYWEIGSTDASTFLYYDCVVRPNVE